MVAPDETTYSYLAEAEFAPKGRALEIALSDWKNLATDEGASYDRSISFDASTLEPMITFGTNPGMAVPITAPVPDPKQTEPGKPLLGHKVDVVFLGSCTNGRLSDLRQAAQFIKGRKVSKDLRMLVVPGSQGIKRQAEAEGLDRIFLEAGAEWRNSGCSLCLAMNGDELAPGQVSVSTTNRNFEGRQGKGGRTFLSSPLTAAASAVAGEVTDVRTYL
jgi:3-isopropylmalate/(R)-2-methylmalate dehydratase large subunit